MNILLLSATGFIGSQVTRQLAHLGHTLTLFHRGKTQAQLPEGVRHIHGDRRQLSDYAPQFREAAPDIVVDLLALFEDDAQQLVNTFRGLAQRLVVISSMDVYRAYGQLSGLEGGEPESRPFDEDSPLRSHLYPYRQHSQQTGDLHDRYDKIPVERLVMNQPELSGTTLRLPAVYGPGDKQHRVGGILQQMDAGEIKLSPGQANWKWTRGYVENVAAAIALATTDERAKGRIYNVGSPEELTEEEWVRAIATASNWHGPIHIEADAEDDTDYRFHLLADTTRIRRELGYTQTISFEEGLHRTIAWEREAMPKP